MPARAPFHGLVPNQRSRVGATLAMATAAVVLVYSLVELGTSPSPKLGALVYFGLPCLTLGGLLLLLWGHRVAAAQSQKDGTPTTAQAGPARPNEPAPRRLVAGLLAVGVVAAAVLGLIGVQATRFSSSLPFCAGACHEPMEPTVTAFHASPHAEVTCADCHQGAGVTGFVRAKASGVREAWAMTRGSYTRPIFAAAEDLPPTAETCQACHPAPEPPAEPRRLTIFRPDEANTTEHLELTMTSSASPGTTDGSVGIDWHHDLDHRVTYVALDEQQQHILWVSVQRWDGTVTEYSTAEDGESTVDLTALPRRQLDCVGCHNRTGHRFESPSMAVDQALTEGRLPASLPWIKTAVVSALVQPYESRAAAQSGIAEAIEATYRQRQPDLLTTRRDDVERAIDGAMAIYGRNVFPKMGVDWQTYPDNIGHRHWPGCFRCHDDQHRSPDGQTLSKSCTLCHDAPRRSPAEPSKATPPAESAWHPWDMPADHVAVKEHDDLLCHQCHRPGNRPRSACEDCHR